MKKPVLLLATAICTVSLFGTTALAAGPNASRGRQSGGCVARLSGTCIGQNASGLYFVDEDHDGICDNYQSGGNGNGSGTGNGSGICNGSGSSAQHTQGHHGNGHR